MPVTFQEYLRSYPEVYDWYRGLSSDYRDTWERQVRNSFAQGVPELTVIVPETTRVQLFSRDHSVAQPIGTYYHLQAPVDVFSEDIDTWNTNRNDMFRTLYGGTPEHPPGLRPINWTTPVTSRNSWSASDRQIPNRQYRVFIPYHSFKKCAICLDIPELKAAQIAVLRILNYLKQHVERQETAEIWRGYNQALIRYGIYVAEEYVQRGGSGKVLDYLKTLVVRGPWTKPNWVYDGHTLDNNRKHLLRRGLRRSIAKAIHKLEPRGIRFYLAQFRGSRVLSYHTLRDCDTSVLNCFKHDIERQGIQIPLNFYPQYNGSDNA
jgi:hypothetical protein